jgi:hypothetical protein
MNERDTTDTRRERNAKPRKSTSRSGLHRPALVAACIGIILSSAAAFTVACWASRAARAEFEVTAETQAIVLQNGINEYVSRLSTLRTLFESAHEDITRSEYETFSSRLFEGHSGFLRLAWAPKIRRKERAEYEAAAIADGVSGYFIKSFPDGTVAAESDEYYPVYFSTEQKTSRVTGWTTGPIPSAVPRSNTLATRTRSRRCARSFSRDGTAPTPSGSPSPYRSMPRARHALRLRTAGATSRASSISPSFCNRSATRMRQIRPSASACTRRPLPVPATWRSGMHPIFPPSNGYELRAIYNGGPRFASVTPTGAYLPRPRSTAN